MIPILPEDLELEHEAPSPSHGRFVLKRSGREVGELTYRSFGTRVYADHTFVVPELRGERLAIHLVAALVRWVKAEDKHIVPECSYVRAALARHPEWKSLAV